jgi:hypothetical protein
MELLWLHYWIHQATSVGPAPDWLRGAGATALGFCAICAWLANHGVGWFGMGAGSAGAGAAGSGAGGGPSSKPRKVLPLPGGGWLGTDGRIHYGKDVGIGPFDVHVSTDAGAAPGSDPRGPLVDDNYDVKVKVGPATVADVKGHATVGISQPVQDAVSSPMGGQGTQSGAWLKQFMNEP